MLSLLKLNNPHSKKFHRIIYRCNWTKTKEKKITKNTWFITKQNIESFGQKNIKQKKYSTNKYLKKIKGQSS